jgi:two-component SAPR family response regulator
MRVVLVDDDFLALQGLKMELDSIGGIEIAGMYQDGDSALKAIRRICPDVVFLDIEMPGCNGLELFWRILEIQPYANIVFVTAFTQYALQAFELNSRDYLVKPVQKDRLLKTIARLRESRPLLPLKKIKIACFRHFSIHYEDRDINVNWRTRKAEELLAYLICKKGDFVAKEKIADALWPELDGDKSMANLYLTYYYITKQEAASGVIFPIESVRGKMRFCMDRVDCDLLEFDRFAEDCKTINSTNASLAENALALYTGHVFEDSYYSWVVGFQQEYERIQMNLRERLLYYYQHMV